MAGFPGPNSPAFMQSVTDSVNNSNARIPGISTIDGLRRAADRDFGEI